MTVAPPIPPERAKSDWRLAFVERLATIGDPLRLSRTAVRLFAWLVVCDPPHQSAPQIQAGLQLSAGSVSTGMNALVEGGFVTRLSFPNDRHRYYEIRPDGWKRLLATQLRVLGEIRRIADQAVEAAGPGADRRLSDMRDLFAGCESMFAAALTHVPS